VFVVLSNNYRCEITSTIFSVCFPNETMCIVQEKNLQDLILKSEILRGRLVYFSFLALG